MRTLVLALLALLLLAPAAHGATTVWAVGDGAVASSDDDVVAARIEQEGLDHFLYLGDVYDSGTSYEYATRYDPSYGRFKQKSSPTPGNHEWGNRATGYDPYWGALAPQNGGGHWYSRDAGGWHLVSLNSEEPADEGSAQLAWLRTDLAAHPGRCTIAFWHKPRYSAGLHGDNVAMEAAWAALSGRAVAVLSGHDHDYQRLQPDRGLVQFVVGTGGAPSYAVNTSDPRLSAWAEPVLGALRLSLEPGSLNFAFVDDAGARLDSGTIGCRSSSPSPQPASPAPAASLSAAELTVLRPRNGVRYRSGLRTLRGRLVGGVGNVRLTLARRKGHRLRKRSITAGPGPRWRVRLRRSLARGRWRLTARASGLDGHVVSRTVRFRVR